MKGAWRWVFTIFLSVSWASKESDIQENIPFETLNCHNDFSTRIICQWEEMTDVQHYLNLALYRKNHSKESDPVSCEPGHNISLPTCRFQPCVPKTCYIRQETFVSSQIDVFSFRTDRPLELQLNVNLTQNIQPPPPENLKIMKNGDEGFLLSWEMPQSWNQNLSSLGGLKFSVTYKRPWESWEEASTVNSSLSQVLLGHDRLIPDNPYVARVRAMTSSGRPSWWSSEISWKSQEGDAAQPKNLQCLFDGHTQLNCTWEVRPEVARSVSFGLFYKNGADEVECKPMLLERKPERPYIQYSCQIHVEDPINQSPYTVTVKTKKKEKSLPSREHIQLHPPFIMVKTTESIYRLKWNISKIHYSHMSYAYEVQYKKSAESWKAVTSKTQNNIEEFEILKTSLDSATEYSARVRTKIAGPSYSGTWSEWSNECSWKTDKVFSLVGLGVVLVIITILGLLGSWCCYNFGTRLKTNWENNIPNPSKSLMFQDTDKKCLMFSSNPWEKEREYSVSRMDGLNFEDKTLVSPLTALDPQDMSSLSSDSDPYPVSITLPDEDPSLSTSQKVTQIKEPAPGFAFNGPYLHFPQRHSLPNLSDQMGSHQAEGSKKKPSGSLEYLILPKGGQGNLVPMAKLAEPGRNREEKESSSGQPSSREKMESCSPREQVALPSEEPRQEKNLSQIAASFKGPLKLAGGSGYIAPEDLVINSGKSETPPPLTMPPILCSTPESSLNLSPGENKRSPSAPNPEMLALGGYVEAPPNMASGEAPPEKSSPLQLGPSVPNLTDTQQDENITVFHPEGLVLQQIGDYCFIPSQGQMVSPSHCPEKMAKPQNMQGKEPPAQPLPQVPAIQLFKTMKHQEYLILPTCPGQVC
ncbi:cytokine receptor common subunit beta isoform X1 [Macrotis lagotis]|uniref:cytokine receptor common subunit beta isoform X1 n=1 Tax=Macrotis lagotis TaxID=92651 RepID=UPI003D69DA21